MVTEFAHKDLRTFLSKKTFLLEDKARPIIWNLISALNYLHSHRVLHRDLKPQNILLDAQNQAKLCDFGFARNMSTGTHVLTSIKGTPLYMAPELIEEQPYDYKADLWSLGCIMYEILIGAPPFCAASILRLIRQIREEQIQWPTFLSPDCISFLKGLLQKDPLKRFSWEEILNHSFIKGHILICDDFSNKPLTRAMSANTLQAKEQQRKEHIANKTHKSNDKNRSPNVKTELELKNNNLSSQMEAMSLEVTPKLSLIEETHPIETEEWIVFLQKSMEEVIGGEMMSLSQPNLANIIVSPLRNLNTSPKVSSYVAKLLILPFAIRSVPKEILEQTKQVYIEVKVVPNLLYAVKLILRSTTTNSASPQIKDSLGDLNNDSFNSLEHIIMLVTHLIHLDHLFLSQLCDSMAVLNLGCLLAGILVCKSKPQIVGDLLAILTHILRVFPENYDLVDGVLFGGEEKTVNFIDLLRHNQFLLRERACFLLLFLGKNMPKEKVPDVWNETVRETLEALMYDSIESVRNVSCCCVFFHIFSNKL